MTNPLYVELINDPNGLGYAPHIADGDDGILSAIINYKNISEPGILSASDINRYFLMNGFYFEIAAKAADNSSEACVFAVKALELFSEFHLFEQVILDKVVAILDGLVADGLSIPFTNTDKANILAMGDRLVSRADQLGVAADVPAIALALRG